MKKIRIKDLIRFNNFSDNRKKSLINRIKKNESIDRESESEGGGDYWIRSISAISNFFKNQDIKYIKEKIQDILQACEAPNLLRRTKTMYERNLAILYNYEDKDITEWLPKERDIFILSRSKKKSEIFIDEIPIYVNPNQVYYYEKDSKKYVGGIWFLAQKDGFKREELGVFVEAMYIYLSENFGGEYIVSEENCKVIDIVTTEEVDYRMIKDEGITPLLKRIIKDLKTLI